MRQCRLHLRHTRQVLAVVFGNADTVLVHDRQVELDQAKHIEIVAKAGAGVEHFQGLCDARGISGLLQPGNAHRLASNELENHHVVLWQVIEDAGTHAGLARHLRVVVLVDAVDGEQFRRGARNAHDMRHSVDVHQVVRVRQAAGKRVYRYRATSPLRDLVDDLGNGNRHEHNAERGTCRTTVSMPWRTGVGHTSLGIIAVPAGQSSGFRSLLREDRILRQKEYASCPLANSVNWPRKSCPWCKRPAGLPTRISVAENSASPRRRTVVPSHGPTRRRKNGSAYVWRPWGTPLA